MMSSSADALFWIAVVLCAVAQVALLYSFFFGASRPGRDRAASFKATETLWAIVPAAVLVVLLTATWQRIHEPPAVHLQFTPAGAAASAPAAMPVAMPVTGGAS